MSAKAPQWHFLVEDPALLPWQDNQMAAVQVAGKRIGLARKDGAYFAFALTCPHAGGLLTDGWIDALGQVVCPLHRYRFSLANGRNTSGEGYHLRTYPLEARANGWYIGLPAPGLFGW